MTRPALDLLLRQAVDLHRAGRVEEAVRAYRTIVRKEPRAAGALNLLGLAEFQLGHLPKAAEALARAAKLDPGLSNIDYNLGRVLQAQGRLEDALPHYQKAVARAPQDAESLSNLGTVLAALGRHEEAIAQHQRAVTINPRFADAWHNLGNALKKLDRYDDALVAFGQELTLRPDHIAAMASVSYVLNRLDRPAEAIEFSKRVLAITPDAADQVMDFANALATAGRDDEALAAYDRAIALDASLADAPWNKGVMLLSRGRFTEGWPLYEQRWNVRDTKLKRRAHAVPRWAGHHVPGTLLVWAEQGLGDQILYASMIRDLHACADEVVLEVDPRLVALLSRSLPGVTVMPQGDRPYAGAMVAEAALGDIGRYLRPDEASFRSSAAGYLKADRARAGALRDRLRHDGQRIIGLSWGSINREVGRSKSARLAELAPVLRLPGCRFVDLQYGDTRADREQLEAELGIRIEHLDDIDNTNDIDGLAALMAACDAVVTVSNTNAHLAAAQGKATFVLLPDASGLFWYWMKRGPTTPVYDSARLFRKKLGAPWAEVATVVASAVKAYLDGLMG